MRELNQSGRFRAVFPAAVFDLDDADHALVPAAVLVTDGALVAVGYDLGSGWTLVEREEIDGEDAGSDPSEDDARVQAANRALQRWARETDQRWADPAKAGALLDAFDG